MGILPVGVSGERRGSRPRRGPAACRRGPVVHRSRTRLLCSAGSSTVGGWPRWGGIVSMSETVTDELYRVCVKLYSPEPEGIVDEAAAFVPIFHEWIRERALNLVLID